MAAPQEDEKTTPSAPAAAGAVKYDSSEADAQATRGRLLRMAASGHLMIGAAHIAFPGLGRIRAVNGAYEWLPLNYDGAPAAGR